MAERDEEAHQRQNVLRQELLALDDLKAVRDELGASVTKLAALFKEMAAKFDVRYYEGCDAIDRALDEDGG